jgi:predicted RNA-binding Zn-ribbon protein involved in translation (DUF1610 family)
MLFAQTASNARRKVGKEKKVVRFQCSACSFDDHATWAGELVCPRCGTTTAVRAAIGIEEMTDHEVEAFTALASQLSEVRDDEE